ncbi:MAG: hypothetical protein [Pedras lispivirus]
MSQVSADNSNSNVEPLYDLLSKGKEAGAPITPDESRKVIGESSLAGIRREWPGSQTPENLSFNDRAKSIAAKRGIAAIDPLIASSQQLSKTLGDPELDPIPTTATIPDHGAPDILEDYDYKPDNEFGLDDDNDMLDSLCDSASSSSRKPPAKVTFSDHIIEDVEDENMFEKKDDKESCIDDDNSSKGGSGSQYNASKLQHEALSMVTRAIQTHINPPIERMANLMMQMSTRMTSIETTLASLHAKVDTLVSKQSRMSNDITAVYADISAIKAKIQYQPTSAAVAPPVGVHPVGTKQMTMPDLGSIKLWMVTRLNTQSPELDDLSSALGLKEPWVRKMHHDIVPNILDGRAFLSFLVLMTLAKSNDFRIKNPDLFSAFKRGLSKAMVPGAHCVNEVLLFMTTPIESDELGVRLIKKAPSGVAPKSASKQSSQDLLAKLRSFD